ncbi:tRNA (guanine(10)-N(2))-methyltransferase TRMT11-like [Tachypleus tridentatus]|uniref:tRNA (guanine(10)-N(2))-methyltransferase TRMT11-like n=1 Tax=Tachypleus tridentatus TaxID=6853 RepID=UPI003FD16C52
MVLKQRSFILCTAFFLVVQFREEQDVKKLMSRTVLIRSAFKLWGQGATYQELHTELKQVSLENIEPFCHPDKSFKVEVETLGKKDFKN